MKRGFLVFVYLMLSVGVVTWLFANWYVYSMAEFDCADRTADVYACAKPIHWKIGVQSAAIILLWAVLGGLLIRPGNKF